jgi:hypothetical protein
MALPKCLVVPFCHPYQPGQFAKFGLLYQIMPVQDVADETQQTASYRVLSIGDQTRSNSFHCQSMRLPDPID